MNTLLQSTPTLVLLFVATLLEVSGDAIVRMALHQHLGAARLVFFRAMPTLPILVGGVLIVGGGVLITYWKPA